MTRIVCISDTHTNEVDMTHEIPEGDILLHAGDLTNRGSADDVRDFAIWTKNLNLQHKHKIIIAGNHDFCFEKNHHEREDALEHLKNAGWTYLEDSGVKVEDLYVYGSPWQPEFCDWAFNVPRGPKLKAIWDKIPVDTDLLITHGPPMGILDYTTYDRIHVGCEELLPKVLSVKPKLHVFGHIHEGYGVHVEDGITFCNASVCTLRYKPVNKPLVFYFDHDTRTLMELP